ncbi:[protein-PII] uridylyltransferase [Iodidimonas sp. SYSU 1G8]|uniref:[protein-PII] uridylyltransferase n=1 Tax=Iodidimonas sp. SYSU 1G8 TaxID=3133967 RepID=UPI0031FEF8E3
MQQVANRKAIIDRQALIETLERLAEESAADKLRGVLVKTLQDALAAGDAEVRRRLHAGEGGRKVAHARSFLIDQLIRVLYDFTLAYEYRASNPSSSEHLSVVAVGGYGRAEMAPFSDVDLLFLLPYKQTAWGEQVVEFMLYVLWDLGLKVGYSVRSVEECLRLSRKDLTIRTALLEMRYVWGDRNLFEELRTRFDKEVVAVSGPDYVEAKLAERDERHKRMGDSRYLVEPNLKDGKGGLRDLHTLYWLLKYLYRADDVGVLVEKGVLSATEKQRFDKAEKFLWTVRCHLHDMVGRAEERLTFDVQKPLSERLNYTDHAGTAGVERFMKHYFLVAKDIGDLTRIFCAHLEDQHQKKPLLRLPRIGLRRRELEGFEVEGDRLGFADPKDIERDPVSILRLFRVAQKRELDIHPEALRLITRNLGRIDKAVRNDPEANAIFLEMLTSPKDPGTTLRRLNEAGVFGRFIPDFGRVVAQMQHDMYHHYTVDEHTIRAIEILSKIEAGNLGDEHPTLHKVIHKVLSRRVMYVSVLLHDIAKGRGGDHSVLGAKVAERLCPRLGFSEGETEATAWLVRWHLLMSNTAFKRDISDPKTIKDFCDVVQSPERLRLLVCLTVVDIKAVGPGVWNGWKGQLLRELYYNAEDFLTGGHLSDGAARRAQAARDALRKALADWSDEAFDAYAKRHYDLYWTGTPLEVQIDDARLVATADAADERYRLAARSDTFQAATNLTIYTQDHPGLFARIAGAIALLDASIVDAKIFTTKDGMALDHFTIQDRGGTAFTDKTRLQRLEKTIQQTMAGEVIPRRELAKPPAMPSRTRKVFTVAPIVLIDNNASHTHTVIEVNGRDRPGFVHDVTRALFDLKLTISSAHIATYGERAVDTFYVRDLFGHKITHEGRLKAIEDRLLEALREPPGDRRAAKKAETKDEAAPTPKPSAKAAKNAAAAE